jgi:DNA-3-methyladenine glycosylase
VTVDRSILELPTLEVGRALLGSLLIRDPDTKADESERRIARIVEVEAYDGPEDLASHARFGRTARNGVMYGPPGRAYVYLVYGMHDCLNIVTEPDGTPSALLIRAVEPLEGVASMRRSRARRSAGRRRGYAALPTDDARRVVEAAALARLSGVPDALVASGPGLVAAAFDLDRSWTGRDLFDAGSPVRIEARSSTEPAPTVVTSPRVGVEYAGPRWTERPWRLSIIGHPSVSRPRPAGG